MFALISSKGEFYMKRQKGRLRKRVLSISLAVALVTTSLNITVNPTVVKKAEAAAVDSTMETNALLDERYVKDPEVLKFYKILANSQIKGTASELSGKPASEILQTYTSSDYIKDVYGTYLTEFSGKINFSGLTIKDMEGIGWARAATEIDLSGATFATPLTEVPAHEFAKCAALEKIILPGTVNKIGNNAFESCLKLKTLMIGGGEDGVVDLTKVDEVGASAFSACAEIETVNFSAYGTRSQELKIGEKAFASCHKLGEIEIPIKTAGNLGANAFENCESLARAGLQNELGYLSNALFSGAGAGGDGLSMYIIGKGEDGENRLPEQITYIGDGCFQGANLTDLDLSGCTKLTKINQYGFAQSVFHVGLTLPESLEEMEEMAFNASGIFTIDIPEKCTKIGEGAFARSSLSGITLPKSLQVIPKRMFNDCEYLNGKNITIQDGSELTTIEEEAFSECERLTTTSFLSGLKKLTSIGSKAFASCHVFLKQGNTELKNFYGDKRLDSGLEEVILPDCVQTLGTGVFANDYALKTADLGAGIVHIPDQTFYNTTAGKNGSRLEKVIVSGDLDSIGEEAFANQCRLHTIGYHDGGSVTVKEGVAQFKNGLLSIGNKAFSGCGVQSEFDAPGAIAYVKRGTVKDKYEAGLSKFMVYDYMNGSRDTNFCQIRYINEENIVSVSDMEKEGDYDKFLGLTSSGREKYEMVYLVAKEVYLQKPYDQDFLVEQTSLEVYELYDTVTDAYKDHLFSSTEKLPKVYLPKENPDAVVSREPVQGADAFWIKVVTSSPAENIAVKNAQTHTFKMSYVFGLKDVVIPDTVIDDNLGENAFNKCINMNEVTLSKNLTEIKNGTFSGAGGDVLNAFDNKKELVYHDYYGLRSIRIPDSVKTIGTEAFANCPNLLLKANGGSSFGTSVESIGDRAFTKCYSLDSIQFPTSLKTIGTDAFATCSIQENDQREITYKDTNTKYKYWRNLKEYGTKDVKKGLNVIDFTAATNLEQIGSGAFRQTNVEIINMTKSPLVQIPDRLFEQCTYLKTVSFQNKTEAIGSQVLKDTVNITAVTLPATATVKKDMLSGAFGSVYGDTQADPTLTFEYDKTEMLVLPLAGSKRLPINVINKDNLNGAPKITVDTGNGTFKDIIGKENAHKGMYAEVNTQDDPYSFVLYGTEAFTEPLKVRVEVGTSHQCCGFSNSFMISQHTLEFQVKVQEQPTEKIMLSAAEDTYVKKNPAMYVEGTTDKLLYVPFGQDASKNGITLTANLEPLETTDDVTWTSNNPAIEIVEQNYEKGSGVSTAKIQTKEIGDGIITVQSGQKMEKIHVYSVIPVVSNGITCTTNGTFLAPDLKPNSSDNPFGLSVGDMDRISISMNYGDTDYTEDQIQSYGERWKFTTSDEKIVSINEDGTFKALAEGDAVITVTAQGSGAKLQFYLRVDNAFNYTPTSVQVTGTGLVEDEKGQKKATVNIGDTVQLASSVTPSRASQEVTWMVTSGKDIISVDENGVVTALKKGTGKVAACAKEKEAVKSNEITFEVLAPATELRLLPAGIELEIGKEMTIGKNTNPNDSKGYFVSPVDTTDTITWSSSNEGVVTVVRSNSQSVVIKAVAAGTAVLTGVASSGVSGSVTVTVPVKKINVSGITVDKEVTLNVGGTHQLNPQIQPADANEAVTFTYSTSNDKIATVTPGGLIQAVGPGRVTITAKTSTGKAASCTVTVKSPAKKVTLLAKNKPTAKKIYMAKGQTVSLRTDLTPDNTTDMYKYKSNKAKIATVTASGSITAKKKGTAKITVTADSKKKATITVIVQAKEIKAKKVAVKAPKTMKRGKRTRLTASLKPAKSTDTLSFTSSNSAVAKVDECGYVTALKKGTVKITVTAGSGKKVTKKIKVK